MTSAFAFLTIFRDTLNAYNKLCEPILKKYDLPKVSFDILMFLNNNPKYCTTQEISKMRNIKKNLVSVHVDKLVNSGFLERNTVEGDRRKIALSCTDKANDIIIEGMHMQKDFFNRLMKGIPNDKLEIYNEVIEIMSKNADMISNS